MVGTGATATGAGFGSTGAGSTRGEQAAKVISAPLFLQVLPALFAILRYDFCSYYLSIYNGAFKTIRNLIVN